MNAGHDVAQSAKSLYLALFMFPLLRHVISVDFDALNSAFNDGKSKRTFTPDVETMVDQYVSVTMHLSTVGETFDKWLQLPAVAIAETKLANEFHANWRTPSGSLDRWKEEVERHATLLSYAAVA